MLNYIYKQKIETIKKAASQTAFRRAIIIMNHLSIIKIKDPNN